MENNKNISVIAGIVILIIVAYFIGQHSKNFNSTAIATSTTEQAVITNATSSQESENLEVLQSQCAQLGMAAQNAYIAKYPEKDQYNMMDSVYHYNTRLKECLWGRQIIPFGDPGQPFTSWQGITNLYSNKDILSGFMFYSGDKIPVLTKFYAGTYIDYPNEEGGGVINNQTDFDSLYNKTMTE